MLLADFRRVGDPVPGGVRRRGSDGCAGNKMAERGTVGLDDGDPVYGDEMDAVLLAIGFSRHSRNASAACRMDGGRWGGTKPASWEPSAFFPHCPAGSGAAVRYSGDFTEEYKSDLASTKCPSDHSSIDSRDVCWRRKKGEQPIVVGCGNIRTSYSGYHDGSSGCGGRQGVASANL